MNQKQLEQTALSLITTPDHYDLFLEVVKEGRMKRNLSGGISSPWKSLKLGVPHDCLSEECLRKWSPPPIQVIMNDDYYCPSCVLHHRNNVNRFRESYLEWSAHIPNTFYLFEINDPKTGKKLYKFGRTQHADSLKRYSTSELENYEMHLLLQLRGRLETMTRIENWWKEQAELMDLFSRFSDESFHGLTECLEMETDMLDDFISYSNSIEAIDRPKFEQWTSEYCERLQQFINQRQVSTMDGLTTETYK